MNIFKQLGGKPQQMRQSPQMNMQPQNMNQFMQMFQEFQQNPAKFLKQAGFNIPQGMQDVNEMKQYIMNSGRLSSEQSNQAQQMFTNAMQFMPRK